MFGAAGWFGEVAVIAFVLMPMISKLKREDRPSYVANIFPKMFRLASVFSLMAILSGAWLNYLVTGWKDLITYANSSRGLFITIGGIAGLALALFHFFMENRIESRVASLANNLDEKEFEKLSRYLLIIPRLGILILIVVILLMMIGARAF